MNKHAFGKENAGNPPGDFSCDSRAALGRDISARVEEGRYGAILKLGLRHLHGGCLTDVCVKPAADHQQNQNAEDDANALSRASRLALVVVDAQRTEIVLHGFVRHVVASTFTRHHLFYYVPAQVKITGSISDCERDHLRGFSSACWLSLASEIQRIHRAIQRYGFPTFD